MEKKTPRVDITLPARHPLADTTREDQKAREKRWKRLCPRCMGHIPQEAIFCPWCQAHVQAQTN